MLAEDLADAADVLGRGGAELLVALVRQDGVAHARVFIRGRTAHVACPLEPVEEARKSCAQACTSGVSRATRVSTASADKSDQVSPGAQPARIPRRREGA